MRRTSHAIAVLLAAVVLWGGAARGGEFDDAAWKGDVKKIAAMLKANPKLVFTRNENGYTPLTIAASTGNTDIAKLLLAAGANVNAKNHDGDTPLQSAVYSYHKEMVELLLARGANANARDRRGRTPLFDTARHPGLLPTGKKPRASVYREMTKLLIAHGADVNARDEDGYTPLHGVADTGQADVVELLLKNKANVNARDKYGDTPLDSAASGTMQFGQCLFTVMNMAREPKKNTTAATKLLLKYGAVVNEKNDWGITPLHSAALAENLEVAKLLLAHGADVNARDGDRNGKTPLSYALDEGKWNKAMVDLLRKHGAHE